MKELVKELNERIEEAKTIKEELMDICNKAVENVKTLKWLVKDLDNYIFGFRTLPALQETLKEFLKMRDKLKELEEKVSKPKKHFIEDKEMKNKYRFRILWEPLTPDEIHKLKEQSKTAKETASRIKKA